MDTEIAFFLEYNKHVERRCPFLSWFHWTSVQQCIHGSPICRLVRNTILLAPIGVNYTSTICAQRSYVFCDFDRDYLFTFFFLSSPSY